VILNFGRHCRGLPVGAVNPAEIEVENEQGSRMLMIFKSLAKTHRQARVTAVKQAHGKVCALNVARAD
jgi:hypothetical protein